MHLMLLRMNFNLTIYAYSTVSGLVSTRGYTYTLRKSAIGIALVRNELLP